MEPNTLQKEVDDIPKILEQEIFTQGVLGYCSHFGIPNKNNYNINFPHFIDFESLYLKEKYLKQLFDKSHPNRDSSKLPLPSEASAALNQVLIAKNNYQRIMLQMLDTIFHQEQKIKSHSFLLEFHNAYTSHIEKDIDNLKDLITSLIPEVSTKKIQGHEISTRELTKRLKKIKEENKTSIHYSFQETPFITQTQENPLTTSPDFKLNISSFPNTSNKDSIADQPQYKKPSPVKRFNSKTENSTPISRATSMWDPKPHPNKLHVPKIKENNPNKIKKSSSYLARRSSETSQSINEDLSLQNTSTGRLKSQDKKLSMNSLKLNGSKSHRGSLGDIMENNNKPKKGYLQSARNRSRDASENTSMENSSRDLRKQPKKPLLISSTPEDCDIYKDEASKKKRGVFESGGLLKAILNNKNMKYNDAEINSNLEKISKIHNSKKHHNTLTTSMQNKDISFQSSTSNLFEAIEITSSIIKEEPSVIKEERERKHGFWPRNQSAERTERGWPLNPVASPNFGTHSNLAERSPNRMSDSKNRMKMTPTKSLEKKENDQNILGKLYCGALLKKKKWTPLLSKKNSN